MGRKKKINLDEIFLTDSEILNIELQLERKKNKTLELQKQDGIIRESAMQSEILKYKIDKLNQRVKLLTEEKSNKLKQYQNTKKEYKELIETITKKYKLDTSNWGFNPDTGKVIVSQND